jgi:hydroxypyruvate reductase
VEAGAAVTEARASFAPLLAAAPRWHLIGAGKAAAPMLRACLAAAPRPPATALLVAPSAEASLPATVEQQIGGHPVPTAGSLAAGERALAIARGAGPDDVLLVLLSGGASALMAAPAAGVTLADKRAATAQLLREGADIHELNTVRKHLSRIKGGRLAAAAAARTLCLAISDVVGDDVSVIGSGPCVGDPTTFAEALAVAARRDVPLPVAVRAHLEAGARGERAESLKPGDPRLRRATHVVLGSFETLRAAAERAALGFGITALPLAPPQAGDVAEVAALYAARARVAPPGTLLVGGGEPTVTLPPGAGTGGRSQHLALLLARALRGTAAAFLAAGSDGTDGPTDAAGAAVTGATWDAALARGLDPQAAARRCDSHPLHAALGTLVRTGATGTNLLDLHLLAP